MTIPDVLVLVVRAAEEGPEPNDVVAGWTAFAIFVALILAVVFLGFSLTKRLKNADKAEAAGLYDPSTKKERQRRAQPPSSPDSPA